MSSFETVQDKVVLRSRRRLAKITGAFVYPPASWMRKWLFPEGEDDFKFGSVPNQVIVWARGMGQKKEHFYVSKIKDIFTSAHRKTWNVYTDLQDQHKCNLDGLLIRRYSCRSKHMSALKLMTARQRERYRPRGVVPNTLDTAMPSREHRRPVLGSRLGRS